jgi:hypothetical protein
MELNAVHCFLAFSAVTCLKDCQLLYSFRMLRKRQKYANSIFREMAQSHAFETTALKVAKKPIVIVLNTPPSVRTKLFELYFVFVWVTEVDLFIKAIIMPNIINYNLFRIVN